MSDLQIEPIIADRLVTVSIDMENDFFASGTLPVPEAEATIQPLNSVMRYTRKLGGIVIATRDWHPEHTPHFDIWAVHCVAGTEGAEFHPNFDLHDEDIIISKGMGQTAGYSGTEGVSDDDQTIESIIRPRHSDEHVVVMMGGLATDYCVLNTFLRTSELADRFEAAGDGHISLILIRDAISAVNIQPDDGEKAIKAMLDAKGIALSSQEILAGAVQLR